MIKDSTYLWLKTLHIVGAVLLVLGTGLANLQLHDISYAANPWSTWGTALFVASGVVWIAVLVPVPARLAALAREFSAAGPIPEIYWRLCRRWNFWGVVATLLPVSVIYFIVFKGAA